MIKQEQIDDPLRDLIDIIHFSENVSAKIHGLWDEAEIYTTVRDEFAHSKLYVTSILLLTEDRLSLKITESSLSTGILKSMEKAAGTFREHFTINLEKSEIFRQVAVGGETIQTTGPEVFGELFPGTLGNLLTKVMGLGKQSSVLTPLRRHGDIIGVLAISAPKLADHFIPSVRNFAQHISSALELADEYNERKRAEEALNRREKHFRSLIENAPDMLLIISDDATIRYCSPSVERIHGYSLNELVGTNALDVLHPEDLSKAITDFDHGTKIPGHTAFMEFRILHKDGSWRSIEVTTQNLLQDPSVKGIVVNYRDITERKQTHEVLKESEVRYRQLFDYAPDGVTILDSDGVIVQCSESASLLYGYLREDMIGKHITDLMHPSSISDGDEYLPSLQRLEPAEREVKIIKNDGGIVDIWRKGARLKDSDGNFAGVLIYDRDITERKLAEKALLESEAKHRQLFENSGASIIHYDTRGKVILANNNAAKDFNRDLESLHRASVHELFPQKIADFYMNKFKQIMENGKGMESEDRAMFPDGERWFSSSIQPVRDANGNVFAIQIISTDITERKYAEKAQGEIEERFRTIFENANDEIVYLDKDGTVIDRNIKGEDILGFTFDEVIGKKFTDLGPVMPHSGISSMQNFLGKAVEGTGGRGVTELQMIHKNGNPVLVEASISPLETGGKVEGILIILRDITERKLAEERILQHNKELTALNDIAQTISQSIDVDEILNNALDRTLATLKIEHGCVYLVDQNKEDKTLTMRIHRGIPDEEAEILKTATMGEGLVGAVALSNEPMFFDSLADLLHKVRKESETVLFGQSLKSAMAIPLQAKESVLGVMCAFSRGDRIFTPEERELFNIIGHQISSAIENVQLLEEASRAQALEELDKLRTALLASVSHELRTPLTSIKGLASTLTQPDIDWDSETQQDFLMTINRESDILTHIVNDLMEMSQMEAGIMSMDITHSSVSAIVGQLSKQLKDLSEKHRLEISIPSNLPYIYIDGIRVGEVITNLVANAAAYSEEGTTIALEAYRYDSQVIISVTDQGIGIPAEHLDKVFDRFYRLESGIARRRGGTGLGLAICKGIVEAHEGSIWAESTPGQGSKFSFSLQIGDQS